MNNQQTGNIGAPEKLAVGTTAEFDRGVTEEDILAFAANSGDENSLHIDSAYAEQSNFGGRIAHGAFQIGLASAMIGMHLPGQNVLLGSVIAKFPAPLYFPCQVNVRGEILAWNLENQAGQLKVTVREAGTLKTTAEVLMGFTLHEQRIKSENDSVNPVAKANSIASCSDRKIVLVTGASGSVGEAIASDLANDYLVIGLSNRQPLSDRLLALDSVRGVRADLGSLTAVEAIIEALAGAPLYGIVHAAWPAMPKGGLLQMQEDVLSLQLAFGTTNLIRLARLLFNVVDHQVGGRIVAIGSIVGARKPSISVATYSLGKIALEATVNLLAPEMARKSITVNTVCPSYIPAGINRHCDERQIKGESARVPLGRVCDVADVAATVRHLLSPAASFLSGESIGLNGGQL